jgi:hypothetical protein
MRSRSRARCNRRRTSELSRRGRGGYHRALRRELASRAVERGWLIALCALIAYAALASPHIVDGDSAEFATLGAIGGRAHPSGYPLYVLWLRLWSWLPGATAAHTAGLATAILGALAIGVLHAACRAWGARSLAATVSVAILAAAPLIQRYHCEAEVFAMNNLVAALVLWLAAAHGPLRGRWRAVALGVVAGAGLADHLTCALVAPVGVLGVVRAARESRASAYGVAIAGVAIGLVPYAYLLIADGPASWGDVSTIRDVVATFLRRDYGGAASFQSTGAVVPWLTSVAALAATLARSWLWLLAIGGVAMLGIRVWRPVGESRWAWAMLAASFALAGPVLVSRFNIDPHGVGLYVCERFHILPTILLAVPVAALIDRIAARPGARAARPAVASGLAVLGFAALTIAGLPGLARVHSPAMELGVRNLLRPLPASAIAVVIDDDLCFGSRYLQLVRGERLDVAVICVGILPRPWYRAAWARRGLALPPAADPRLGDALLRTARPAFVDPRLTPVLAAYPSFPFGITRRLLPPGIAPPPPADVAALNRDLFRGFALDYPRPSADDGYAAVAHHRYATTWATIAKLLASSDDRDGARAALDLARDLLPAGD